MEYGWDLEVEIDDEESVNIPDNMLMNFLRGEAKNDK